MSENRPTERAMKAAVEMEMHAAVGTRTLDKGNTLDKCFPAYDELLNALQKIDAMPRYDGERVGEWVDSLLARYHKALDLAAEVVAKAEGRS